MRLGPPARHDAWRAWGLTELLAPAAGGLATGRLRPTPGTAANATAHRMALAGALAKWTARLAGPLLQAGADPNAADPQGWTALHFAADHGDHKLAALLLRHGADSTALTQAGLSPAALARRKGFWAVLDALRPHDHGSAAVAGKEQGGGTQCEIEAPSRTDPRPAPAAADSSDWCDFDVIPADGISWTGLRER